MGSPGVAAWIAQVTFWVLIIVGWRELGPKRTAVFLLLWFAGFVSRSYIPYGPGLFSPYVALLDVALVLVVFKGDVRLY